MGAVDRIDLGPSIECPLDYRVNPDTAVLANDQDEASLVKTEIGTSASYTPAQIYSPVVWTKGDEAKNPSQNQKVDLVKQILENGISSHDDLIEQCIFTTSTAGGDELNGLADLVPTSGQGTVGGIDASVETWWRNYADTYTDASDIEATMTTAFNEAMKGSGSPLAPSFLLSGATPHGMYESGLQALQRYTGQNEGNGGFMTLAFKTAKYFFSQYGGTKVYFLNPKSYKLVVSRQYFRDQGKVNEISNQNAFVMKIYSALQFVTNNKSRLAVIDQA